MSSLQPKYPVQKISSMSSNQEFSSDVIFEILSPNETLETRKIVSKGWKQLIYESSFLPLYLKRTNNLFGYFMQDIKDHKYVSKFASIHESEGGGGEGCINVSLPRDDMRILASCNQGILCCEKRKRKNGRYYVGKPATRQLQALPNPKLRYRTAGVAIMVFNSKPLQYKIMRLSEIKIVGSMMEYYCEIFDSKIWTWRETTGVNLPYDELIISNHPANSIGGSAYWLTCQDKVLAFDIAQECFQKFPLPESVFNYYTYGCKRLVEYEGRLGFTLTENGNMEVWLTTSPRSYEWTRKMVLNIRVLEQNIKYPHPVGFCNSDIIAYMRTLFEAIF